MQSYRNRGGSGWNSSEIGSRQHTWMMARTEQNISSSCQHLENSFNDINHDFDAPCPIKLVRRLTALEIALSQLKQDCEMISEKRKNIVQSVLADQDANVRHMKEIMSMKKPGRPSKYRRQDLDTNLNELSLELKRQLHLL